MTTYRRSLRFLGWTLLCCGVAWALLGPTAQPTSFDRGPSYSQQVVDAHDCWVAGDAGEGLPSAAVITLRDDIAARYTEDPAEVDAAFRTVLGEDTDLDVYEVHALCHS